jgi:hypothetical protein
MSNDSYEYGSNIAQPPARRCDEYLDLDFCGSMTFVLIQIVRWSALKIAPS